MDKTTIALALLLVGCAGPVHTVTPAASCNLTGDQAAAIIARATARGAPAFPATRAAMDGGVIRYDIHLYAGLDDHTVTVTGMPRPHGGYDFTTADYGSILDMGPATSAAIKRALDAEVAGVCPGTR